MKSVSLSDLRKKEEDEEKKKNEYYAGGNNARGGGSGLSVLGPNDSSKNPSDSIQKLVDQARTNQAKNNNEPHSPESMTKITLYRNGFQVENGPFRDLDSPENKEFLNSLTDGYIPQELVLAAKAQGKPPQVNIALEDKREEDYRAPTPPPYVAFGGQGSFLGDAVATQSSYVFVFPGDHKAVTVNDSNPTTLLQVKLHDGRKLKLR